MESHADLVEPGSPRAYMKAPAEFIWCPEELSSSGASEFLHNRPPGSLFREAPSHTGLKRPLAGYSRFRCSPSPAAVIPHAGGAHGTSPGSHLGSHLAMHDLQTTMSPGVSYPSLAKSQIFSCSPCASPCPVPDFELLLHRKQRVATVRAVLPDLHLQIQPNSWDSPVLPDYGDIDPVLRQSLTTAITMATATAAMVRYLQLFKSGNFKDALSRFGLESRISQDLSQDTLNSRVLSAELKRKASSASDPLDFAPHLRIRTKRRHTTCTEL